MPTIVITFQTITIDCQWIFTCICIDIVEISGLGLLMGKFHQFLTKLSACHMIVAGYYCFMLFFFNFYQIYSKIIEMKYGKMREEH